MAYSIQVLLVVSALLAFSKTGSCAVSPVRLSVAHNRVPLPGSPFYLAFAIDGNQNLNYYHTDDGPVEKWTMGKQMNSVAGSIVSNPIAVSMYVPQLKHDLIYVFAQGANGQIYAYTQSSTMPTDFKEQQITTDLPATKFTSDVHHIDALQAISHDNKTFIFIRSQTNQSQLYWNIYNSSLIPTNQKWTAIGGGGHLNSDPYAVVNTFVGRIEVFALLDDSYIHHFWQTDRSTFSSDWSKLGGPFSPKFNSAPVVHQMGHSDFNGILNLFVRGEGNLMHQIWQTTCDKVNNPWGPCTWGVYHKLGGVPPSDKTVQNPFSVSHNIHLGVEVFVIGEKDGSLYHVWQSERDGSWSDWEKLGQLSTNNPFLNQPHIVIDKNGWWQAYAFLQYPQTVVKYQQSPLSFLLSTNQVDFDKNVTVTWAIPVDEATHKDWIGVYPSGASSHQYIDFAYVGGTQNPLKDPVPKGSVNFTASLPNGIYSYKYMVNKQYDAVLEASATVSHSTTDQEWVQIYKGIARGLGGINENITECVEDGNRTVETFRDAFTAFENRHIFEGLHLFAQGLSDIRDALVQCDETVIVEDLDKFITDLISCTEGDCVKFLIDLGVELVILYEHEYEIYGDIQAATNCFKIDAYQQGGVCIGRVTNACLTRM